MKNAAAMLLSAGMTTAALGWGGDGHAIVADIAWRELSPEAQAKVAELLDGFEAGTTIQEIGSWADAVRPTEAYQWSAPLHYVNMPPEASGYDHTRDCPEVGCVVSAIDRFARELSDESLPTEQRREALLFLVHFVGDMHQPLHGGRAQDRGGNDIQITLFDTPTNLHRAWDSQLLAAHDASPWPLIAERLAVEIDATDRIAWLADTFERDWTATAGRWAYESHHLAEQFCYIINTGDTVGSDYVQLSAPVIEARLSQGGVRLAAVLEWCLSDQPEPALTPAMTPAETPDVEAQPAEAAPQEELAPEAQPLAPEPTGG
jgi:hypothetical protein